MAVISCERAWELLSRQMDEPLSPQEEGELAEHLAACSSCRADREELEQLRGALQNLEEIPAPADFTARVMDQVRAEPRQSPKVLPLWRRPQMRALAGLAACALLCIGIYRAVPQGGGLSGGMVAASDLSPAQQPRVADGSAGSADRAQTEQPEQAQPDDGQESQQPALHSRTAYPQPEADAAPPQTQEQAEPAAPDAQDGVYDNQSGEAGGQSKAQLPQVEAALASVQTELAVKTLSEQAMALLPAWEEWSVDEQGKASCAVTSQVLEQLCAIWEEEGTEYTVTPAPWSETCIVRLG